MALSDTARRIPSDAAKRPLGPAAPPAALPAAARDSVRRSLLKQGLVAECAVPVEQIGPGWRLPDGAHTAMQVIDGGRRAVAAEAPAESTLVAARSESPSALAAAAVAVCEDGAAAEAAGGASTGQHKASARLSVRDAARALLAAWDCNDGTALASAFEALRAALPARGVAHTAGTPHHPTRAPSRRRCLPCSAGPEVRRSTKWPRLPAAAASPSTASSLA